MVEIPDEEWTVIVEILRQNTENIAKLVEQFNRLIDVVETLK